MDNAPEISIITFAYNAEKYIKKCADSILKQSFSDIEWIVVDNGSTDSTGEILSEYSKKDLRIRLLRNNENSRKENADCQYIDYGDLIPLIQGKYFTTLDSDDYFELDFVKEMISLAKKTDADMVICGNNFVSEKTCEVQGYRFPPDFVGSVSELCEKLPEFYACLRPMWERLYKTETFRKNEGYIRTYANSLKNGGDTFINLKFLQVSDCIASTKKILHNYLMRENSVYNSRIYSDRWKAYDLIFIEGLSLLTKHSAATYTNIRFLASVHINSLLDLVNVANNSKSASNGERILFLYNTVTSPMLSLSANYISDSDMSKLLCNVFKAMWPLIKSAVSADEIDNNLKWKILEFLNKVNGKEKILEMILIGKVLSASLENEDLYIQYSIYNISYLININSLDMANSELNEWERILPGNDKLIDLRKRLNEKMRRV